MAALVLVTAAAYWPVFGNGFVFDDVPYLVENPNLRDGFTADAVQWAFTSFRCANWHPVTWLSAMLDVSLFGLSPAGHHAVNLLFHLANTVLLLLLFRRITGSLWKSAFVAGLFALHPLHVESVAWIAERKDVLSTLFWLLGIWAYVRYAEKPSVRRYVLVAAIFALGLMAKPMLVTLPIVLLLLDFWPLRRLSLGGSAKKGGPTPAKLILEKAPLLALSAASSLITYFAQQSIGAVVQLQKFPIGLRIENALVSYVAYVWKMIWPAGLAAYYPYPAHGIPAWQALGAALVLVGVSVFVFRQAKSRPYLAVGWLWYLIALMPVIGIVQVGEQSMADRYTYVPLIGIFLMIAWGVKANGRSTSAQASADKGGERASGRSRTTQSPSLPVTQSPILSGIAVVVLAALGVCTSLQARYWQSDYTLFLRAVNVTSDNKLARNNLGIQLEAQGKPDEAIVQYQKALEIDPNYADARLDLGNALFSQGKVEEAVKEYSAILKADPENKKASIGVANALAKKGRGDVAASEYAKILESDPNNADAHYNLGLMLSKQGKLDEAAEHYRKALDINPNYAKAHNNLGTLLTQQNKPDEALPHYQEAIRIKPDYAEAHCNLGIVLAGQGNVPEAAQHFLAAVRIKPDYAEAHASLALAYFLTERYAEAWKEVRLAERYGIPPDPRFLRALSEKMPEP